MDLVGNVIPNVLKNQASEEKGEIAQMVNTLIKKINTILVILHIEKLFIINEKDRFIILKQR